MKQLESMAGVYGLWLSETGLRGDLIPLTGAEISGCDAGWQQWTLWVHLGQEAFSWPPIPLFVCGVNCLFNIQFI